MTRSSTSVRPLDTTTEGHELDEETLRRRPFEHSNDRDLVADNSPARVEGGGETLTTEKSHDRVRLAVDAWTRSSSFLSSFLSSVPSSSAQDLRTNSKASIVPPPSNVTHSDPCSSAGRRRPKGQSAQEQWRPPPRDRQDRVEPAGHGPRGQIRGAQVSSGLHRVARAPADWSAQLPPSARRLRPCSGVLRLGPRRARVPRLPLCLQRRQSGPLPSPHRRRLDSPGIKALPLLARLPQLAPWSVRGKDHPPVWLRKGPADEHGRRGGRDGPEDLAQVGLRKECAPVFRLVGDASSDDTEGVPKGKAIIISAAGNFHGRTLGVVSMRSVLSRP